MQEAKGRDPKYRGFFSFLSQMYRKVCSGKNWLLEYNENLENFRDMRSWVNDAGLVHKQKTDIFPSYLFAS